VGLTSKNEATLRRFNDPRMVQALLALPDRLWREARRHPPGSGRAFLQFQDALAIDILLHAPMRVANLCALDFRRHLHWPRGRGKPALVVIGADESKNREKIEYELPASLSDRLLAFRETIAPKVLDRQPDAVFVTWQGMQRKQ